MAVIYPVYYTVFLFYIFTERATEVVYLPPVTTTAIVTRLSLSLCVGQMGTPISLPVELAVERKEILRYWMCFSVSALSLPQGNYSFLMLI